MRKKSKKSLRIQSQIDRLRSAFSLIQARNVTFFPAFLQEIIALRRYDREITNLNEIEKILEKAEILHLGLLDEGYPYVVPLHYGYELVDGKFLHARSKAGAQT